MPIGWSIPDGDETPVSSDADAAALAVSRQDQQLEAALEQLPPERRQAIVHQIVESQVTHSGPLPAPQQLHQYEQVLPGLAERIVRLTEVEQAHRHEIVGSALKRDARIKERGQLLAMLAMIIVLAFCAFLVVAGSPRVAGAVAISLVAAVVGIFVTGRQADAKALEQEQVEGE